MLASGAATARVPQRDAKRLRNREPATQGNGDEGAAWGLLAWRRQPLLQQPPPQNSALGRDPGVEPFSTVTSAAFSIWFGDSGTRF